jgi:hypothetical protein
MRYITACKASIGIRYLMIGVAYVMPYRQLAALANCAAWTGCVVGLVVWASIARQWHQFDERRFRRADRAPASLAQQFDLEAPQVRMIARMGDEPCREASLGTADAQPDGLDPGVDCCYRFPLV